MELRREQASSGPVVKGFTATSFVVDEQRFETGLLLTPEQALAWDAPTFETLDAVTITAALTMDRSPEFLLLGSGAAMRQPPVNFRKALEGQGIGLEVMDSRAAARAWGLLRAEHRWIAAALMPLS